MKKIALVFLFLLVSFGCSKDKKFAEGIYCYDGYVNKNKFDSKYMETFLVKVSEHKISFYGTVQTWGRTFKRNFFLEKSQIINDSVILLDAYIREDVNQGRFIKLKDADKIIDKEGINFEEFAKYLNSKLIAGEYKIGNEKVVFTKDGRIENLEKLKTFTVRPRGGTCGWYDYRTIEINNEMWKFGFTKDKLILTKYLERKDEEQGKLSNLKIVLER